MELEQEIRRTSESESRLTDQPASRTGCTQSAGSPPNNYYTLHVAGIVPLSAGTRVNVAVYSYADNYWRIQHESGFSMYLMERISPGVHAELSKNLVQRKTGWVNVDRLPHRSRQERRHLPDGRSVRSQDGCVHGRQSRHLLRSGQCPIGRRNGLDRLE